MATLYFCVETKEDCEFRRADSAAFWLLQNTDVTCKYIVTSLGRATSYRKICNVVTWNILSPKSFLVPLRSDLGFGNN